MRGAYGNLAALSQSNVQNRLTKTDLSGTLSAMTTQTTHYLGKQSPRRVMSMTWLVASVLPLVGITTNRRVR